MLRKAKQALEFGHQRRVLFLCRLGDKLLLDVRLDSSLHLDFEEVKFVAVLDVLNEPIFEDGLERSVRQLVLSFKPSPGRVLVAVVIKLNHLAN